jgi:hypothetical protein
MDNELPTEPGFYWARREGYDWIVVEVTLNVFNQTPYYWATGCEIGIVASDFEWGEKIEWGAYQKGWDAANLAVWQRTQDSREDDWNYVGCLGNRNADGYIE